MKVVGRTLGVHFGVQLELGQFGHLHGLATALLHCCLAPHRKRLERGHLGGGQLRVEPKVSGGESAGGRESSVAATGLRGGPAPILSPRAGGN